MFGRILLAICAAAWCVCAAFALAAICRHARRAMRQLGVSARVVFLLAAAAGVMLAGGKGGSVAVHDDYIADAGSYLTNDVAHVAIAKKTPNLPDSTEILVYARELSSTNAADWFRLVPHLTYADHPYDYALPNATNYSVLVSSSFVPEPTVHTNGVWALRGFEIPGQAGRYAFGNSRTHTILTAADYVQDGLIAMWDGIENNGLSSYDPNLTVWKDLTGNGYDIELTANAIVVSNGIKLKDVATAAGGIGMVDYSGNQNNLMFDVCVTYGAGTSASQAVIANGAITANSTRATICAKAGSKFEWSYQWNNAINVFTLNRTMTLTAGYGKGYVNTESFTGNAIDTWGFTNGKIAIGGDPRGTGYAFVKSTIHSVRVYSRELTPEEIQHNYEIDRRRFNLP